ncbi:INTegrator complex Subunit homolog [Caenorhabditis elegans]|nr:INTegrator complex Subunit homolog [Caenorhabditis elegans]CCE72300.1 INTegrator complex Subunit homolog [Caenorhabditis elegans]|eukprot:NP_001252169.1 Uncharacterized protein CELE_Y48G10A.4 [Caenorhabditis elegans]
MDVSQLRTFAVPSEHLKLEPPPAFHVLEELVSGERKIDAAQGPSTHEISRIFPLPRAADPYWIIMTEYDIPTLQNALTKLGPFWFPTKMQVPEHLMEKLEKHSNLPTYNLHRLLLCKIDQLSKMHHFEKFKDVLSLALHSLKLVHESWVMTAAFEMIQVPAIIVNQQFAWERHSLERDFAQTQLIFNSDHFVPNDYSAGMINECLGLMINIGDAQSVLEKGGQLSMERFKSVPIARMFGAYLVNYSDPATRKKCADGFWRTVTQRLLEAQPPRGFRRGNEVEQALLVTRKELADLFHLFSLIRDQRVVDFLLAYAVCLHNKVVIGQRKSNLKIHAKLLDLYTPDPNAPKIDISNPDDVRQLLQLMVEKAYSLSPTDPDTIRTYADFLYVERDFQGAAQKYMEYFTAHSPTLRLSPFDAFTVFDDTVVQRLRYCTANAGYLTMSLLTCQWLKVGKTNAYQKAMAVLEHNETRDVGANCADYVTDVVAIELLSQHYHSMMMTKSLDTLYTGANSLSANKNVPQVLATQEINRRTTKFLTALSSIYFGLHV